jgi:hypothetical protein
VPLHKSISFTPLLLIFKKIIMKKLIALAALCAAVLFTVNVQSAAAQSKAQTTKSAKTKVVYTCTMHPEVMSDKPGKCPKCGMTLVKKTVAVKKAAH